MRQPLPLVGMTIEYLMQGHVVLRSEGVLYVLSSAREKQPSQGRVLHTVELVVRRENGDARDGSLVLLSATGQTLTQAVYRLCAPPVARALVREVLNTGTAVKAPEPTPPPSVPEEVSVPEILPRPRGTRKGSAQPKEVAEDSSATTEAPSDPA